MKHIKILGAAIIFIIMILTLILRPVSEGAGVDVVTAEEHYESMVSLLLFTTILVLIVMIPMALYSKDGFAQYAYGGLVLALLFFWVTKAGAMVYIISGVSIFIIFADVTINKTSFEEEVQYAHKIEDYAHKQLTELEIRQKFKSKYNNRGRAISRSEWRKERDEKKKVKTKERI